MIEGRGNLLGQEPRVDGHGAQYMICLLEAKQMLAQGHGVVTHDENFVDDHPWS